MRLVGHNDLQARSAYQPIIHAQGDRYIAYVGHHGGTEAVPKPVNPMTGQAEFNGTSIIDVTDPKQPKYLAHIPGMEGLGEQGGAQMVRVCDGKTLPKGDPNAVYLLRTFGGQGARDLERRRSGEAEAHHAHSERQLMDTHKSWWECDTGIAYLVSGREGVAHAPHDRDLRPQRSGQAGQNPRLRPASGSSRARPARCRPICTA